MIQHWVSTLITRVGFNLNQPWMHEYTHTSHLSAPSISAAASFINQTNLQAINCPHQTATRMETHIEGSCTK